MANTIPASKEPIPNPAIADQQKKVAGLEKDLSGLQSDLKKAIPPRGGRPQPSAKKRALSADAEAKRQQGLSLARSIDAKKKEIAQARARRVDRLLALARTKKASGAEDESLNAYVESLFLLGPQAPDDAKVAVAREADTEQLKEILGSAK